MIPEEISKVLETLNQSILDLRIEVHNLKTRVTTIEFMTDFDDGK